MKTSANYSNSATVWLRSWRHVAQPETRVVIFPHAGGSASFYRSWEELFPSEVDLRVVQYPGREDRLNDSFVSSLSTQADSITTALTSLPALPLLLFGHSMGAILAYEVAIRLERCATSQLCHLFVSGRRPPTCRPGGLVHQRDDDGLMAELIELGGTPQGLLLHADLRALVLSAVRDDYRLIETYSSYANTVLASPLSACNGDADVDADEMASWAEYTRSHFAMHIFPGNHFYLMTKRRQLVALMLACLPRGKPMVFTTPVDLP